MEAGGLFQVNESTNVFFMIWRDCFIWENSIDLSPKCVRKIGLHVNISLRTGGGKKMSANQNGDTITFHWWKKSYRQSER
jgi:hypothetical protein